MIHRIRAAGLMRYGQRILLVRDGTSQTAREGWISPGGGPTAEDAGVLETARREVFEETGLPATGGHVAYLNEWRKPPPGIHPVEFFVAVDGFSGEPTLRHVRQD